MPGILQSRRQTAVESQSNPPSEEEEEEEEEEEREPNQEEHEQDAEAAARVAPSHHPSAPPDELFDISTTVDPSYIISLIRKLVPTNAGSTRNCHGVSALNDHGQGSNSNLMEEGAASPSGCCFSNSENNESDNMNVVDDFHASAFQGGEDEDSSHRSELLAGDKAWEEYGCILWDLAANRSHAELMVQNLVLEVLLANLKVSRSVRVKEICLGIIGNLACHEVLVKHIALTNGLIATIVDQLFLDDTQCLCEACRLLTLGFQVGECSAWAEAIGSEHILCRIMWIAENTLNPHLLEKSVGLLLAILESQQDVSCILLPFLVKLGLSSLLINLLGFEMSSLIGERIPERYPVLDVILRAIEALSVIDGYSQEVCSDKKLLQLVCDLVKLPDKAEIANSCVSAAVLIANILTDEPDLASEISQDLPLLEGLFDILPFASDEMEARMALWSTISRLLVQLNENEMNPSSLHQYVLVLASKSDLIEDDLFDRQLDDCGEESKCLVSSGTKSDASIAALQRIISILNCWTAAKDCLKEDYVMGKCFMDSVNIDRLLDCCHKHIGYTF